MSKSVSLSDDAYARLIAVKGAQSFSDVILKYVPEKEKRKRDIMEFAGIWKDRADEWREIEKKIYEDRKKFKLRAQW